MYEEKGPAWSADGSNESVDFSTASQQAMFAHMVLPCNHRWHELTDLEKAAVINLGARAPGTMKEGKLHPYCWNFLREKKAFYPAFNFAWSKTDQIYKAGNRMKLLTERNKKSLKTLKVKKAFFCNSTMMGRKRA